MKALITNVKFEKSWESEKFSCTFYLFRVEYDGRVGFYTSTSKEQTKFVKGHEVEFNEEVREGKSGKYLKIKPAQQSRGFSNYGRAVKREQSKYSGFAMAYAKDLVVAGNIGIDQMYSEAQCMMDWMYQQDNKVEQ